MTARNIPRREVLHPNFGESRTKQADAKGADINEIISRWLKSGVPPQSDKVARYGDFSNLDDYTGCMIRVCEAQAEFEKLPAKVRKACGNNPGRFLDMVHDPDKRAELEELGLLEAQVPPAPEPVVEPVEEGAPAVPETPEAGV